MEKSDQDTVAGGVFVKTYGCQMNEYDSEKMISLLSSDYAPVSSLEEAEVVIVNTCSVREKAEHKLYSYLGKLRDLKSSRKDLVIGVGGCVAQQEGEKIIKRNPAVDFVVGTHNLSLVPSLVSRAKAGFDPQVAVDYREEWEELPEAFDSLSAQSDESYVSPVRALVAIQRGCNKNCAFCVVPNTRGPEVSRSLDEILREVKLKVRLGAREVLLLGQTVNSYGRDLNPRVAFENLIEELAKIDGLARIRFTSPHPADVRPKFIELYGRIPQLCPHIHLPLQSGNDRVLKLMNRNYRKARYLKIVDGLRERVPEIAISADIIVGFPTETEEEFLETLEVMERVRYSFVYSFKYSKRPNTAAVLRFSSDEEVEESVAQRRLERLQNLQDRIGREINAARFGQIIEVLVEGESRNFSHLVRGRSPENTVVEVEGGKPEIGELVQVQITHTGAHGLRGTLLTDN